MDPEYDDFTGPLTYEPGPHRSEPQRFAGSTLPDTPETAEAVADRGARHIEMDGGAR